MYSDNLTILFKIESEEEEEIFKSNHLLETSQKIILWYKDIIPKNNLGKRYLETLEKANKLLNIKIRIG